MPELDAFFLFTGIVALIGSWILLLIYSSREDFAWGLITVILPPLSYLYALSRWKVAKDPIIIAAAGWFLIALALVK